MAAVIGLACGMEAQVFILLDLFTCLAFGRCDHATSMGFLHTTRNSKKSPNRTMLATPGCRARP